MTAIEKIRIKGVRGIRAELPVVLGGRSLLLRGDNGTGKSSIAQALQWAVTGAPTSPSSGALPEEFQRHRLEGACSVIVDLAPNGRIVMSDGKLDEEQTDDAGRAYVDACVRSSPFLRRSELLGFLTDSPSGRFKYLERYLELDRVEALGAALGVAVKKAQGLAKEAADARGRLVAIAAAHLATEGPAPKSEEELLARLCAAARSLGFTPDEASGYDGLSALRETLGVKADDGASAAKRAELSAAVARAEALAAPEGPHDLLVALKDAERSALETDLAGLLSEAIAAVERSGGRDSCPVCEQPVDAAALGARLRARAALLRDVRRLGDDARTRADQWRTFREAVDALERLAVGDTRERTSYPTGRALLEELEKKDGEALSARTAARLARVRDTLKAERDAIPDDARVVARTKLAEALGVVLSSREALTAAEADLARHTEAARQLRAVEKAVGDARKTVAEEILQGIGSQVASYYARIHPPEAGNEVTGSPTIKVKRHGAGTAYVYGRFNDQEISDPRFIYSDGHLDTVAICIFLALHKRADSDAKLLVLDDVVLSIDLGHAGRLAELLRDEFRDHQILIFSHNELFMKMCRDPLSHAKVLEIQRWSLEDGPRLVGHVTHAEELEAKLAESGSAASVASAMRPVLDDLAINACRAFEVKVPMTRDRGLTVDEYWSPLRKKLAELKEKLPVDVTPLFDRIGTPSFFRNALGAHSNDWALEVPLAQVQGIARGVLDLVRALQCGKCNTIRYLADSREPSRGFACQCPRGSAALLPLS